MAFVTCEQHKKSQDAQDTKIETLEQCCETNKTKNDDQDAEIEKLKQKNQSQDTKIETLEQCCETNKTKDDDQDAEIEKLKQKNQSQDTKIAELEERLTSLKSKNDNLEAEKTGLSSQLDSANSQLSSANAEVAELKRQLEECRNRKPNVSSPSESSSSGLNPLPEDSPPEYGFYFSQGNDAPGTSVYVSAVVEHKTRTITAKFPLHISDNDGYYELAGNPQLRSLTVDQRDLKNRLGYNGYYGGVIYHGDLTTTGGQVFHDKVLFFKYSGPGQIHGYKFIFE